MSSSNDIDRTPLWLSVVQNIFMFWATESQSGVRSISVADSPHVYSGHTHLTLSHTSYHLLTCPIAHRRNWMPATHRHGCGMRRRSCHDGPYPLRHQQHSHAAGTDPMPRWTSGRECPLGAAAEGDVDYRTPQPPSHPHPLPSLADWLRLGALIWYSLATGQHRSGRLKLELPPQSRASTGVSADIRAGAGGAAGSAPMIYFFFATKIHFFATIDFQPSFYQWR